MGTNLTLFLQSCENTFEATWHVSRACNRVLACCFLKPPRGLFNPHIRWHTFLNPFGPVHGLQGRPWRPSEIITSHMLVPVSRCLLVLFVSVPRSLYSLPR